MSIFVNISFHELNVSPVKPIPERQPPIACVESEKRMAQFLEVFFLPDLVSYNYFKWW